MEIDARSKMRYRKRKAAEKDTRYERQKLRLQARGYSKLAGEHVTFIIVFDVGRQSAKQYIEICFEIYLSTHNLLFISCILGHWCEKGRPRYSHNVQIYRCT